MKFTGNTNRSPRSLLVLERIARLELPQPKKAVS